LYTILLAIFSTCAAICLETQQFTFYYNLVNIYSIFEVLIFTVFFRLLYFSSTFQRLSLFFASIYIFFNLYYLFQRQGFFIYPLLFEFSILIIYIVFYFFERINYLDVDLLKRSEFWINSGLFLYFTGNFFYLIFSLSDINQKSKLFLLSIYCTITILKNLIISIGLSLPEKSNNPDNFLPFADELEINTIQNNPNPG
jgi:hypothetical protein